MTNRAFERVFEYADCIVCGSQNARPIYSHANDRWLRRIGIRYRCKWVMCMGCGLLYQNPRPTLECMDVVYSTAYRSSSPPEEYLRGKRRDAEEKLAWIINFPGAKSARRHVLDVGCSEGSMLAAFQRLGWEVYGVEPTSSFAQWGREHYRIPIHVGFLDERCYPDAEFDLIVLSHVLEHVHDPCAFMNLVMKRLTSGGTVFVEVPDLTRVGGDIAGYLYGAPHLYGFSPYTLRRFLNRAGLRVMVVVACSTGIRALCEPSAAGESESAPPDVEREARVLRRRLTRHRIRFFFTRGWKDSLKWRLIDALGTERAERLLKLLRGLRAAEGSGSTWRSSKSS